MKTKLLTLLLLASSSMFAAGRVVFGVSVGVPVGVAPPPPSAYAYYAPPVAPGYGYNWVAGYWYPVGPRWYWRTGYWARPPYVGARWAGPRYYGGRYYAGHWRR
ncbi:MAG TPA: hypothetical protein VH302_08365 [Bryobacteraceae bacterium]|nr:hypothetical protein [Bryobacteraceae bacterium]